MLSAMDNFPIEVIEHILQFCTGSSLATCSQVAINWCRAAQNVERRKAWFWRKCCRKEIDLQVLEDLNNQWHNSSLDELNARQCKEIYIKWFCGHKWRPKKIISSVQRFDVFYEHISALVLTGPLVITGHRSGRVLLTDLDQNASQELIQHKNRVNDLIPINIVGDGLSSQYLSLCLPFLSLDSYPLRESHARVPHHHVISVGDDYRVCLSPLGLYGNPFEVCSVNQQRFLSVRMCRDLFAVGVVNRDVVLFRTLLLDRNAITIGVAKVTTISFAQLFEGALHWRGLFTFAHFRVNAFCDESKVIACCDVTDKDNDREDKTCQKWRHINHVVLHSHSVRPKDPSGVRVNRVFAFGDGIFFVIINPNQTLFTTDSKTFRVCPLDHWLSVHDAITSIALFGSLLAVGSKNGSLFVHRCRPLERLHYLTHYKPLYVQQLCPSEPITRLAIGCDGGTGRPTVVAATAQSIHAVLV